MLTFRQISCLLYFVLFTAAVLPAHAQGGIWKHGVRASKNAVSKTQRVRTAATAAQKLEKILSIRAAASQTLPAYMQRETALFLENSEYPISSVTGWPWRRSPTGPYEEKPFWKSLSDEAKRNYFISANNRAVRQVFRARKAASVRIAEYAARLGAQRHSAPAGREVQAMAELIGPDTRYIFIGEVHDYAQVQPAVSAFLRAYRARYPKRRTVLLTEFLPQGKKLSGIRAWQKSAYPEYDGVLKTAAGLGMPLRGLEPNYVFFHSSPLMQMYRPEIIQAEREDMWDSPELMRLRNRAWLEKIQEYRAEFPEATFIIYAGAEHIDYTAPFSISGAFAPDETFVGLFYPYIMEEGAIIKQDNLDYFGGRVLLEERFLTWPERDLRRVAGFDARVKLPPAGEDAEVQPETVLP